MILVLSNTYDVLTSRVVEKLHYNKNEFARINSFLDLAESRFKITVGNRIASLYWNEKKVKKIWIRKKPLFSVEDLPLSEESQISKFYKLEIDTLYSFALCLAKLENYIIGHSHYNATDINKLFALYMATRHGLKIPYSIITNNYDDFKCFIRKVGEAIMKPMSSCISFMGQDNSISYKMLTSEVEVDEDYLADKSFFPTLFQEKIAKRNDIRVFYLNESIIALRIHSQSNSKTNIDFRNYDNSNPNRVTLCQLPKTVEISVTLLMKSLNIDTGSLDFIETYQNEYIFLEINPYGMIGHFDDCDIDISELIYQNLMID